MPPRRASNRSRWKKIFTPIVLGIVGLLLLLSARLEYPPAVTDVANASLFTLAIDTSEPVSAIVCIVAQTSSAKTEVLIGVAHAGASRPRDAASRVTIVLYPPSSGPPPFGKTLSKTVTLSKGSVVVPFTLKARRFGLTYNGVTASAAIPRVIFEGPGAPTLYLHYESFPGASSYDWSSFPAAAVGNSAASWEVFLSEANIAGQSVADAPGQIAAGINHSAQASYDRRTFYAGALLGLAGGAILSAIQEALSRFVG